MATAPLTAARQWLHVPRPNDLSVANSTSLVVKTYSIAQAIVVGSPIISARFRW